MAKQVSTTLPAELFDYVKARKWKFSQLLKEAIFRRQQIELGEMKSEKEYEQNIIQLQKRLTFYAEQTDKWRGIVERGLCEQKK